MPDKIWLHKDTKYNTGDIVCGYQYEFAQEIECEGIENFVEYVPADAFIEKAENFLEMLGCGFTITDNITHTNYGKEQLIAGFKEYLKK